MPDDVPGFTLTVHQNEWLPVGSREVHAILDVRTAEAAGPDRRGVADRPPASAEVIVIDQSGSMTGLKIQHAAQAAIAAVEVLPDGTHFAVVAGESTAHMVYPHREKLVRADPGSRADARKALEKLSVLGGTHMSTWLHLTDRLLTARSVPPLRHALMLTDGLNTEGESALDKALEACRGHFVCDCRGVGDDWNIDQVKHVAQTLLGTWKPIADPEQLAADFRDVMAASARKRMPDVALRVRKHPVARLVRFAQVQPSIEDLTASGTTAGGATVFALGSWGNGEKRSYHLQIDVEKDDLGLEVEGGGKAAGLDIHVPGQDAAPTASATVRVRWTADPGKYGVINERVAVFAGQEDLARLVNRAVRAWNGQEGDVTALIGQAVALAHRIGRDDVLEKLSQIARIDDPEQGVVRPRPRNQVRPSTTFQLAWETEQTQSYGLDDDAGGDADDDRPPAGRDRFR